MCTYGNNIAYTHHKYVSNNIFTYIFKRKIKLYFIKNLLNIFMCAHVGVECSPSIVWVLGLQQASFSLMTNAFSC